jgi:hypothetical protein
MSSDIEVVDPLLQAIAELRSDVNRLIDEQVASVKERIEELASYRPLRVAPIQAAPEPAPETSKPRSLDPRQRLDALAKHLDHRLRQATGPGVERGERTATPEG